jgi:tripartite-type tricarboxylate transporter receptor subunit TctC
MRAPQWDAGRPGRFVIVRPAPVRARPAAAAAAAAAWVGAFAVGAFAADAPPGPRYPVKPIRVIVASTPASGPDIVARLVAQHLGERWGESLVVDNRTGAGGNVGAEIAARAPADGYTVLMATAIQPIAVALYPKLNYDLLRDFAPVSLVASTPYVLVVNASQPVASVKELVALARAKPGQLHYGSGGSGTPTHLSAEIFRSMAKLDLVHVPYKGVTPALTDLVGGQVQLVFSVVPAALPFVRNGKLRALGVSSAKRSAMVPDLPPIGEALPGFEVIGWYGLLFPAGTAAPIVARMSGDVGALMRSDGMRERLSSLGAEPIGSTAAEFAQLLKAEVAKWAAAVRASGAKVE